MGSGAAVLDYDNDGRLDLYLLQGGTERSKSLNRLYHQGSDGRFTDATNGSGLGIADYGTGVAVGDINNDGLPDVLVCGYRKVRLFLNTGRGKFRDVTKQIGINNPYWAVSAAFFDYDRDGWLDLIIVNYVDYIERSCPDPSGLPDYCGPSSFTGTPSRLYHNLRSLRGDKKGVRFDDVTLTSGLGQAPGPGLGVVPLDFNSDGWPDILITQDGKPNRLWINQHNGTFQDEASVRGIAVNNAGEAQANMGIGVGDLDGRGLLCVYVTHLTEEGNTLWRQTSRGLFEDHTAAVGLAATQQRGTGFGIVLADFDNNGFSDIALVNGRVRRSQSGSQKKQAVTGLGPHWNSYAETNQIFANDGKNKFREISAVNPAFCATPNVGRGLACGDIWNDGSIALLTNSIGGRARLYRNVAPNRGHWLTVRAIDPRLGGRDAYGARITLTIGGRRSTSWINPAYSMACSNDPRAHFGLGSQSRVGRIEVLWPDGKQETFPPVKADRVLILRRGSGTPRASS